MSHDTEPTLLENAKFYADFFSKLPPPPQMDKPATADEFIEFLFEFSQACESDLTSHESATDYMFNVLYYYFDDIPKRPLFLLMRALTVFFNTEPTTNQQSNLH